MTRRKDFRDRTGEVHGLLTVLPDPIKREMGWYWRVQCECGTIKELYQARLDGRTKSCGCRSKKNRGSITKTAKYRLWCSLKQRCYNPESDLYYLYGEKGATIVPGWFRYENFDKDTGAIPPKSKLIRPDETKPFGPKNFAWERIDDRYAECQTRALYEFNGEKRDIRGWAKHLNIKYMTLYQRIFVRGWTIEKALTINPTEVEK